MHSSSSRVGWHGPPCPLILAIAVSLAKYVSHKWYNLSLKISLRHHFTPKPDVSPSSALRYTSKFHVCPFLKYQPDMALPYLLSLPIMPLVVGGCTPWPLADLTWTDGALPCIALYPKLSKPLHPLNAPSELLALALIHRILRKTILLLSNISQKKNNLPLHLNKVFF